MPNTFRCEKDPNDYVYTTSDSRYVEIVTREGTRESTVYLRPAAARKLAEAVITMANEVSPAPVSREAQVGDTLKVNRNGVAGTGCRVGDRLTVTYVNELGDIRTNGRGLGAAWHFHASDISAGFLTLIRQGEAAGNTETPREVQFRKAKELAPEGASTTDLLALAKFLKGGE